MRKLNITPCQWLAAALVISGIVAVAMVSAAARARNPVIGMLDSRRTTEDGYYAVTLPLTVETVDLDESAAEDGYYAVTLRSTDAYPRVFVLLKFDSRDELTKFRAKQVLAAELRLSPTRGEEDDGDRTDK